MGKKGMGWVPDYPDVRDCTLSHEKVKGIQSIAPDSSGNSGSDDRAQQLFKLIAILEDALPNRNIIPNLSKNLSTLKEEFQQETDQKLHFISANFTDGFLSLGSEGKEVQDLQDKLRKLDYLNLESDPSGYYGRATEAAVKEFQTNQSLGNPNGIYTPFTRAELLAWVSIAGKLGQSAYRLGVSGPSVIYIHALLNIINQLRDSVESLDLFTNRTYQAIQTLQQQKGLTKEREEQTKNEDEETDVGIIDKFTWDALTENENKELRGKCPKPPVPRKKFEELKEEICKIIENVREHNDKEASSEREIELAPAKINATRLRLELKLEPIIEVLIQLAPCMGNGTSFQAAIEEGYDWLLSLIRTDSLTESSDQLALLAQRLEQGRGYVSSKIFRYESYKPGVSGAAVTYIQERLRAMGHYNGSTTGYFDKQLTQDAVKKFQSVRLKQPNVERLSPDGIFKREDMNYLTSITEKFIDLEPPLPNDLTDSLIADLGGLEEVFDSFNITDIIAKIQNPAKPLDQWVEIVQSVIPPNALNVTSETTLKKIIQGINDPSNTPEEKQGLAKQFLALILRLTLHSIVKLIAQLISPIGKYSDPQKAFKDGLKRFRVILYLPQVKKIDRILNGLLVDVLGDIDGLTKEYEPLVVTLAVLKAEFRQQELACEGLDVFAHLQSLMAASRQAVRPMRPSDESVVLKHTEQIQWLEKIIVKLKNWVDQKLSVDINRYVDIDHYNIVLPPTSPQFDRKKDQAIDAIFRRDQTFIRVDPDCDRCSLQLPVTGKMHRALSQPTPPSQATGECNTTYTTYLILPDAVDLSIWCSDVEDQGELDSCTAHAGVGLLEYFEKKSFGNALDASSRFLYKVTRNLMHREGDTGASVRETMKAMVLFGVPPEEYCPYDEANFDDDPSAFCYAFAQNYQTITYFRLDAAGMPAKELLAQIKTILVGGFPCMFGFTVYDSIRDKTNPPGHIPYPTLDDKQEGGHAAIVVGYNDYKQIKNATNPGALLIKNSWGTDWGDGGYGWLPYDYVLNGLARDWWSLIKSEWVESKQFGLSSPDLWSANLGETLTSAC